jgi:two-component system sensor kinase FixL
MTQTAHQQPPDTRSALLLEQLLQIAKISALEEMASGIAHELNQPIGAMATFAQAAERMLDRPEPMVQSAIEVLRHISQEALNAGKGIRRIRGLFDGHRDGGHRRAHAGARPARPPARRHPDALH